jgi:hypothetical protein
MELPTYTGIWKTKRIFYKIEDIKLPMPVPADVLLMTAVCFAVWDLVWWGAIGTAPFKAAFGPNAWFAVAFCWYALPPFFAARLLARPNREGKNIIQVVKSSARYALRAHVLDGYVPRRQIKLWLRARSVQATSGGKRTRRSAAPSRAPRLPGKSLRPVAARLRALGGWVVRCPGRAVMALFCEEDLASCVRHLLVGERTPDEEEEGYEDPTA